jgi:hypothetical protein
MASPNRPTTLWLTGLLVDRQTTSPLKAINAQNEIPLQMLAAAPVEALPARDGLQRPIRPP